MDLSSVMSSLYSCASTYTMQKAMGKDAQAMATLLQDLEASIPAPPPSSGMDISV